MWVQTHGIPGRSHLQLSASRDRPESAKSPSSALSHSQGTFLDTDDDTSANVRDSLVSIIDDPFLISCTATAATEDPPSPTTTSNTVATIATIATTATTPTTTTTTTGATAGPGNLDNRNVARPAWPPPRKESLTNHSPTPWVGNSEMMDAIHLAVIGALGVGKSSFIQRALRQPRLPSSNVATVRADVEGVPHLVTLIELDLEYFDIEDVAAPGHPIQWPKQVNGQVVPRVDGALILYDVTNEESIRDLPSTLNALASNSLPFLMVATKCDAPENLRVLDPAKMASLAASYPACIGNFRASPNSPSSQRDCLQIMLKAAVSSGREGGFEKSETAGPRRRAASAANLDAPPDTINGRPISQHSKHSRASSDLSLVRAFQGQNDGYYRGQPSRSPRGDPQGLGPGSGADAPGDAAVQTIQSMLRTPGIRLDAGGETFLDVEESDAESYRYSDDIPILQRNDDFLDRQAKMAGVSFDELVDRLLAPRMSRADNNFADIFLCLYRKFAAPLELLAAIRARLDRVKEDKNTHYLMKVETQLRMVEVVAKWLSLYPGDFARRVTRENLEQLIRHLSSDPIFSAAAHQMKAHLNQKVVEDDDTWWAKSDEVDPGTESGMESGHGPSDISEGVSSLHLDNPSISSQRRPSQSSELSGSDRVKAPARFQYHSYEDYEREAATMVPSAVLPLTKIRYRSFMAIDPDDIADEITRIDWIMFSSIRIRDLVRHVSLPADQKEKCKSLKNVNRMINHFNHVAKWVANVILIRDKAKHRAPCLEKFMVIALRLRYLNNYNGLAAVLAGINGTAIHRLAQTRALVNPDVQKRFARLVLLMGTQKSHFAYRLAWENSPMPRIPFMPLHRHDLVSAEEGSRTFVGPQGDRINWKKFEVLGEVLLPIMRSQGTPYQNLNRHDGSRDLILDCLMSTDEEEIYQRSVQVESGAAGVAESSKKKFPWLPK